MTLLILYGINISVNDCKMLKVYRLNIHNYIFFSKMPRFHGGRDKSSNMAKERLIWADSLKGWLMILVILGHVIQCILKEGCNDNHVWNLIYSFHMPACMAVSGWLAIGVVLSR